MIPVAVRQAPALVAAPAASRFSRSCVHLLLVSGSAGQGRPASRALPEMTMSASDNWSEGASLPPGLEAAKKSCKQSAQLQAKSCYGTGHIDDETREIISGIRYHLPFTGYDLCQTSFDRLSDTEQSRFERYSVIPDSTPDSSASPLNGDDADIPGAFAAFGALLSATLQPGAKVFTDSETGAEVSDGRRFHLPFTNYDIGQRTFDRLPQKEQLLFEKFVLRGISWNSEPILMGRDGYAN